MNKLITLVIALAIVTNISAQKNNKVFQYILKLDSSYLFVDNSENSWYTLELKTDTMFNVNGKLYYCFGKAIQIGSREFNNGHPEGVMGSVKAEEYALKGHKKWELDYQKKLLGINLKSGEELFYNQKTGKPFLIWWYNEPKYVKEKNSRQLEVEFNRKDSKNNLVHDINDSSYISKKSTHQLFLEFVANGITSCTIYEPVLEAENLNQEIEKLKTVASTLNVYGSYIDLDYLKDKYKNPNNYVFRDSLNQIEIELPSWLNVVYHPNKNVFFANFPEKENICNALILRCVSKSDTLSFNDFIKNRQANSKDRDNLKLIVDDENIKREFYTLDNSEFYCQAVYLKGKNTYCYVIFTSTKTTYDFNLQRFEEFLNRIKLK